MEKVSVSAHRQVLTLQFRRPRRLLAAWLGAALILLNGVAGALVPAVAAEQGAMPFLAALDGDAIVLCTPNGLRVIDPQTAGREGAAPVGPSGTHGFCTFCLPLTNVGAAAMAAPLSLPLPKQAPVRVVAMTTAERPVLQAFHGPNPARAPPAV